MKNKKKQIPGLNTRVLWIMNPRTRVHDNDIRKNKKKMRQTGQKVLKETLGEYIQRA